MSLIAWNDYFVTGIDIIDEQHRWLIDLINRAATVLVLPYDRAHEEADELLDQLTQYAVFHFQTEARLMSDHGVDRRHVEHHLAAHSDFATHVGEMREKYEKTGNISGGELLTFLANWLIFHILSEDQILGRQLVAIRNGEHPDKAFDKAEGTESDPVVQAKTQALMDLYGLINQQYSNLQEVHQELEEHKQHLERMVHQRTEQLAQARDLAEAASRAKSTFLANMGHEFRTPMNAIVGMSWALRKETDDPAQKEKLDVIAKAADQLQKMLDEILDMVKLESEEMRLEPVDFSLAALIAKTSAPAATAAASKGLRFSTSFAADIPDMLHGDARRIAQILSQLLSNAVKFTDRGEIRLRIEGESSVVHPLQLRISVSDTGPGISPEDISHLFHPFELLDPSTSRAHGGAGLGLALSQRLARLLGGSIGVSSELHKGSEFTVLVPVQAAHAPVRHDRDAGAGDRTSPAEASANRNGIAVDGIWLAETLYALRPLVANDEIQALNVWAEAAPQLHAALGSKAAQIEHELERYEFQAALAILDDALRTLPVGAPRNPD